MDELKVMMRRNYQFGYDLEYAINWLMDYARKCGCVVVGWDGRTPIAGATYEVINNAWSYIKSKHIGIMQFKLFVIKNRMVKYSEWR